jgi:FkbH-like protein
MSVANALQQEIDGLIASGDPTKARMLLAELWTSNPGPALASFVTSRFKQIETSVVRAKCRVAVIRSFTVEPAVTVLAAAASINGLDLALHVGDFNAYARELLDANSSLNRFQPAVVIMAVQTRDISPDLWQNAGQLSSEETRAEVERVVNNYRDWVASFRQHNLASLVIHNLEMPPVANQGIIDAQGVENQVSAIQDINRGLRLLAHEQAGVYVLDYDALVARHGRTHWHDERKWQTMRMPVAADCLVHLATEWLRYLHPLTGKICKALVVDLDNTFWGGVVGEVGAKGIQCGTEFPGSAYRDLQRAMLDLQRRGILLAVCSKNNLPDAMEALRHHPGLLLRPEHFSAMRINWNQKSENLREIAAELNIGTDSIAFLDDNPVERHHVRLQLPEVTVIDLPADVSSYERTLRESPVFERLALSREDKDRGQIYLAQRQRSELREHSRSVEEFNRSLLQEVALAHAAPESISRISQLTQKTNQFNLTNHRYSEQEILDLRNRKEWLVITAQVRDRFGDNGLVGLVIVKFVDGVCQIDTFLLSCRVIGRAVETVMLAFVIAQARARGVAEVRGMFCATAKNAPASDFYSKHGFAESAREESGASHWTLRTESSSVTFPDWTKVVLPE